MVSPNEKLANALTVLSELQGEGADVFRSRQLPGQTAKDWSATATLGR